ncbi:MAG: thiamine-phosphate kinase [Alphaproteobacteria bacterium]
MAEFERIRRFFAPLTQNFAGAANLTDDVAIVPSSANGWIISTDSLVEGVHFLYNTPPEDIAWKALGVNYSDLAAKGAAPCYYFLNLALPAHISNSWVENFARGLGAAQQCWGGILSGGDSVTSKQEITISITALGKNNGRVPRRDGAQIGDMVWVSGTLGDGAAGLLCQQGKIALGAGHEYLVHRYTRPTPRLQLAAILQQYATAAMDISDGLLGDLAHIACYSGVNIEVMAEQLPLSKELRQHCPPLQALDLASTGGDDYEIVFTAPLQAQATIKAAAEKLPFAITSIGRVVATEPEAAQKYLLRLLNAEGGNITPHRWGWEH